MRRLSVSVRRRVPASSHSWLNHPTPALLDHLKTSCSRSAGKQSRTCLPCSWASPNPPSWCWCRLPYFNISIQVCRTRDRGTTVYPHHIDSNGQQGGDAIEPRALVCWLIPHSSFSAISARSTSRPLSIWCRMANFVCRVCGVPVCEAEPIEVSWVARQVAG